ncbi:MAG: TIGR02099 family protein, partial [Gammaproteobacteria bacterium]|nr:TIGR02099 family protein [Gammaproteobacteria bacterium]
MKKWHHYPVKVLKHFGYTLIALLVLLAVLLTSLRFFTPLLNTYKTQFEGWASTATQHKITVERISASFTSDEPAFVLHDISIQYGDQSQQAIHIPELSIGIDLLSSLLHWTVITGNITVTGLDVKAMLGQNNDLTLYLNGVLLLDRKRIDTGKASTDGLKLEKTIGSWILAQHFVELRDMNISWSRYDGESLQLTDLDATLANSGSEHRLRGAANIGAHTDARARIGIDMSGDLDHIPDIKATLFFGGDNLPIGNWFRGQDLNGVTLNSGYADIKIWADWAKQNLQVVQTKFSLSNFSLSVKDLSQPLEIRKFSTNAIWNNLGNGGWNAIVDDLSFSLNGHAWPDDKIAVSYIPEQKQQSLYIRYLDINDVLQTLLIGHFIPDDVRQKIIQFAPQGQLEKLRLLHTTDFASLQKTTAKELLTNTYISAQLQNVGMKSVDAVPGFDQLDAHVVSLPNKGSAELLAANMHFDIPKVFSQTLNISNVETNVSWSKLVDGWQFSLNKFSLELPNTTLQGQASLNLDNALAHPKIRALFGLHEKDLSQLHALLPDRALKPHLYDWLNNAFVAGKGLDATIVFNGDPTAMPFNQHQGIFLADAQLNAMTLEYGPGWPTISGMDADAEFRNDSMLITSDNGKILDISVDHVNAVIPALVHPRGAKSEPVLTISATAHGDTASGLDFVHSSPLEEHLSGLKMINGQGAMQLNLHLYLPLVEHMEGEHTQGKLTFTNNTLTVPSQKLTMDKINGILNFTEKGATARNIRSEFLGYPARIDVSTVPVSKTSSATLVSVNSKVDQKTLAGMYNSPLLQYFQGTAAYQALLRLQAGVDTTLRITSNLQGISINLPTPFDKAASDSKPLNFLLAFPEDGSTNFHVNYDNQVDAAVTLKAVNNQNTLYSGDIMFGGAKAQLQTQAGLLIGGHLTTVDVPTWQTYFNRTNNKVGQPSSSVADTRSMIRHVALKIDTLNVMQQTLYQTDLTLDPRPDAWFLTLNSNNIVGTLLLPDDTQKNYIIGDFDKLYLMPLPDDNKKTDPSTLPKLDIKVKDFLYKHAEIQGIYLRIRPMTQGLWHGIEIQNLNLQSNQITLTSIGTWLANGVQQKTSLNGQAQIADLGAVLKSWDVTDKFKSGSGQAVLNVQWPDSPTDFELSAASG